MELRQYFAVVWKWLWLIVLGTLLAGGTAYLMSRDQTPIYRATAMLLVSETTNPAMEDYSSFLLSERLTKTYAKRLTKESVLEEVMDSLGLTELSASISVQPIRDTQLLLLSVEDPDPRLAMELANRIPGVFIRQNETMQLGRFAEVKDNLAEQLTAIERDMEVTREGIDALQGADSAADRAELARLQGVLGEYQSSYIFLTRSYQNIRLAEGQAIDSLIIDEPARLPQSPIGPRVLQNTLLAAVVGAMLAVGVAFLIEYLDDTIKTVEDVRQALGLSALGAVTQFHQGEKEADWLIASSHPRSPISEGYRALRTNLQFSTVDNPLRTLLITSANPIEGKSTTVANLGVVMAQAGLSVVLVDSDLRRPALHKFFQLPNAAGLTSALLQEGANPRSSNPDGYLQATEVENLRVLTSGPLPPNPSELLGSRRMGELIERLKGEADVLLFDSPPALAVTDAAVLANQVDGVLLVVDAGTLRRDAAQRVRESLNKVGANLLGVALNKISAKDAASYYYYYYYSSEEGEPEAKGKKQRHKRRGSSGGSGRGVTGAIKRWMRGLPFRRGEG